MKILVLGCLRSSRLMRPAAEHNPVREQQSNAAWRATVQEVPAICNAIGAQRVARFGIPVNGPEYCLLTPLEYDVARL